MRLPLVLAMLASLAVVQLGFTEPAQAATVGGFEIDGNTPDDPAVAGVDWGSLPASTHQSDPRTPGPDTSNFQGSSKEFDDPATWSTATGVAPNQDDIVDVYAHTLTTTGASPQVWAFFGFRRVATTGVTNYDVELNQAANSSVDPPRPVRTVNDLLLQLSQDGNNAFTVDRLLLWTASGDFIAGCIPVGNGDFGWCPRPVPAGAWQGATGEGGLFAEGALNITALSFPGDCRGAFGTLNIRSFTGNDAQSALKDYVEPMAISVPGTCVAPLSITNVPAATYDIEYDWRIHKAVTDGNRREVPAGTDATFTYRLELEALPAGAPTNRQLGGTITLRNPNTHTAVVATLSDTITGGGACTINGPDADPVAAGHQVSVPAATTAGPGVGTYTYTCNAATSPEPTGTSTATVSWDPAVYPQGPGGTYTRSAAAPYTYTANETDETASVTDVFNGGATEAKGDASYLWSAVRDETDPGTPPHTVVVGTEYTRNISGVDGTCTPYSNIATATEGDTGETTTDSQTVTVCVGLDLDIDKVANLTYQRTYEWDVRKSGPGTVFTGEDGSQRVTYTVDVEATGFTDSGRTLGGTIYLDNPNDWQAITGTLSDEVTLDGVTYTCTIGGTDAAPASGFQVTVAASANNAPFTYTCPEVPQGAYVGTNTATITWDAAAAHTPHGTDSQTVGVTVSESAAAVDSTVDLTDVLDGTGVPVSPSSFTWATVRAMTGDPASGLPAHTQRLTYTRDLTTSVGECTPHTNVVTLSDRPHSSDSHTVTVCAPSVTKTVRADFGRRQLWDLTKEVDRTRVEVGPDGTATFHYTVVATPTQVVDDGTASWTGTVSVTNPSPSAPLTVDVSDVSHVTGWTCAFTDDSTAVVVPAGTTVDLRYGCSGEGHPDGSNTATVSFGDGEHVSTTVPVSFTSRTGVADSTVTITDDIPGDGLGALTFTADAAGGADTFTYDRALGGVPGECVDYTNTAVLAMTGDDPTAQRTVTVCEEAPLLIDVDANADKVRTFHWGIDKQVDQTRRTVDPATGTATFHYTVKVTAGAATDSDRRLSGQVTVTNPNTYPEGDITADVQVDSADLGGGVACDVNGGDNVVIPAHVGARSGVVTLPYTCTFTTPPADTGTVHAQATWTPPGASATTRVSNEARVAFTVRSEVDKVVDVVDDKTRPGQRVVLEQGLTWAAGLTRTYEYDLALPGTVGQCVDFTNTAKVDITGPVDPSDSTTVTVCTPRQPAAAVIAVSCTGYDVLLDNTLSAVAVTFVVNAAGTAREITVPAGQSQHATGTLPGGTQTVSVSSAGQQLAAATRSETCIEVLPAEASGRLTGSVRASCQGTVRARMKNTTGARATFVLLVGKKRHTLGVQAHDTRKFQTSGKARARVVLKVGPKVLDRTRIPERCAPPEVLPDTGLRTRSVARENSLGLRS